ncbi:MAG TPA: DUF2203 domain-containing protein [Candidatus Nanoarchaeia archaeon]|nr:DUF2203 domain-containing protein [Candidatus Nanoarchaeia archaeon]
MIKKKYFTLEEAIEILPKVKILLGKLFKIQNKLKLHSQIQIDYDDEFLETAEVIRNELIESKYVYEFFKVLHELIKIGVFVKNPDIGLVDFYSKFGDEDIFLCYKYPEKTISFWHGVGEGFTRRKNIESLKKTSSR